MRISRQPDRRYKSRHSRRIAACSSRQALNVRNIRQARPAHMTQSGMYNSHNSTLPVHSIAIGSVCIRDRAAIDRFTRRSRQIP
jgi:hypothetical protein